MLLYLTLFLPNAVMKLQKKNHDAQKETLLLMAAAVVVVVSSPQLLMHPSHTARRIICTIMMLCRLQFLTQYFTTRQNVEYPKKNNHLNLASSWYAKRLNEIASKMRKNGEQEKSTRIESKWITMHISTINHFRIQTTKLFSSMQMHSFLFSLVSLYLYYLARTNFLRCFFLLVLLFIVV